MTELSDSFLRCRILGHSWDEVSPALVEEVTVADSQDLLATSCSRCTLRRLDIISKSGDLFYRRYFYPDGYLTPRGSKTPSRSDFRRQLIALRISRKPAPLLLATNMNRKKGMK